MDYHTIVKISEKLNQAFHDDLNGKDEWEKFKTNYPNIADVLTYVNAEEDKFYKRKTN